MLESRKTKGVRLVWKRLWRWESNLLIKRSIWEEAVVLGEEEGDLYILLRIIFLPWLRISIVRDSNSFSKKGDRLFRILKSMLSFM
jgi:hypothetical protein